MMTIQQHIDQAKTWGETVPNFPDSIGWRTTCRALAEEVERLQGAGVQSAETWARTETPASGLSVRLGMIEIYTGGEDCPKCGGTKPIKIECPWCAIKTLEGDCERLGTRVKELESENAYLRGGSELLKQEVRDLRRLDPGWGD